MFVDMVEREEEVRSVRLEELAAVAGALDRDKLERLVLPAAFVSPAVREELTNRLGSKVEFR